MTRTEACIALNLVPNLGPVRLRKLLEQFESPERVLSARAARLEQVPGIGPEVAASIAQWESSVDLQGELAKIRAFGASLLTPWDAQYPQALREIHNPPIALYVWGKILERDKRAVAVVGSRKSSFYGVESAKKLSFQLAYAGLTVVSGLARGIDTAAHQGALAANGRTLAVLGSGLNELYPAENFALAEKIAASGAVLSEYPMDSPPAVPNFPYRNRIVAGWGNGILVVEAGLKSGALITANQAIDQGRMVYAVPGPIDRATSAGTNRLIQQGAKLVTSASDILDDLNALFPSTPASQRPPESRPARATVSRAPELTPDEALVVSALARGPRHLDELAEACEKPVHALSATLLALELRTLVEALPGTQFRLRSSADPTHETI